MEPTPDETGDAHNGDVRGGAAPPPTRALPIQRSGGPAPYTLASYYERAAVLSRLKDAFAEGRLDDDAFDRRMRTALAARTHGELQPLVTDLPGTHRPAATVTRPAWFTVALNGTVRRAGRWRVPGQHAAIAYKGRGELDLRAAALTGQITTLLAVGYRSTITVFVPPGVLVQAAGLGVRADLADFPVPADAPVVNVRGLAYKGRVEVLARPR